jgi:predicted MFS family arabinose efflux permease
LDELACTQNLFIKLLQSYKQAFSGLQPVVWIISFVLFINRVGAMVLMFSSLYFTQELHFSKATAGIIMSFFGIGSIVGSYVGGWLADRFPAKPLMLFALIASGCVLLLILTTKNPYAIGAIIFLYALVSDAFRPASSVAVTNASTAENRTRSVSLMRLCINLGFTFGPAIGGLIAAQYSYTWLYVIDAATSFVAAIFLFFYYPATPTSEKTKSEDYVRPAVQTSAYRNKRFLIFILLVACYGLLFFQIFASVPTYCKEILHYSENTIGLLLALNGALVVLIEMPLVQALQNYKPKANIVALGCLSISVALAILLLSKGNLFFVAIYVVFMTMSEVFAMPQMMSYALSLPIKERQGQYSALYSIGYGISIILAPIVGLSGAQYFGFTNVYLAVIVAAAIVGFAFTRVMKS